MTNKINSGKVWDYIVPAAGVTSGDMVLIGDVVGIAVTSGVENDVIAVEVSGTFDVTKKAADVVTAGAPIYYRSAGPDATITASTNKLIGYAVQAAAGDDATVRVRLKL